MYYVRKIITYLVIVLLLLDFIFILVCNFNIFGCLAIKIDDNSYLPDLKANEIAISIPQKSYEVGDVVIISNLDEYQIEKIKDISRNIVTTTSMDGKVTYDLKNLEDVVGKIKIRINLSMIITFITTLSLGILYLIFDYYLLSKKDSKAN